MDNITLDFGRKLTEKEIKILEVVGEKPCTITEISKLLNMDYKNAWRYCNNLYEKGVVSLNPPPKESTRGSPVLVSITINSKGEDIIYSVLNRIKSKGGRVSLDDFYKILSQTKGLLNDIEGKEKINNLIYLEFISGYIQKDISLTKKAEDFLKEQNRKQNLKISIKRKLLDNGKLQAVTTKNKK